MSWVLRRVDAAHQWEGAWANLSRFGGQPRQLSERLARAVELYPCDAMFVHRDQEARPRDERLREIEDAASGLNIPIVPVVPKRMTEAWLLFDEAAIRQAAGNPNGSMPLDLPKASGIEALPDPKEVLYQQIRLASALRGRRLEKLRPEVARNGVGALIGDYSPLLALPAFAALVKDTADVIARFQQGAAHSGGEKMLTS